MPSSKDRIVDIAAPRRRSLFATIFVPDIGADVRPLRETTAIFVNLIAMLFVMNGLFPKNHPGLAPGSKVRLSLHEVIHTAWSNVSMTKEKLPQTLFFFAVVGCMGITGLAFFIAICSLFIGKAHAQVFTPPGGTGLASADMAQQFINYLFQGQTFTLLDQNSQGASSPVGTGGDSIIQCSMYVALGVYSDAILIVAAMILFYHLAWMTVETAHHGVVMGQRGNQIWAPIRLVFAIGLLVPVGGAAPAGCAVAGTGMNSGQFLVIAVAQWGSGLASNVWATFLNALANNETYQYVPPPAPDTRKLVQDAMMMYACDYAFNWNLDSNWNNGNGAPGSQPPGGPPGTALDQTFPTTASDALICDPAEGFDGAPGYVGDFNCGGIAGPSDPPFIIPSNDIAGPGYSGGATGQTATTRYTFANAYAGDQGLCGSFVIPASPVITDTSFMGVQDPGISTYEQGIIDAIYTAQTADFVTMLNSAGTAAFQNITYFINGNPDFGVTDPNGDVLSPIVLAYQDQLTTDIQTALTSAGPDASMPGLFNAFQQAGWITAGAWFNRVARVQADITVSGQDGLPQTSPPSLPQAIQAQQFYTNSGLADPNNPLVGAGNDPYSIANSSVVAFQQWLTKDSLLASGSNTSGDNLATQREKSCIEMGQSPAGPDTYTPTDMIFWLIDHLAACNGVWHPVSASGGAQENLLGVQFTSANPLAEIAAFGNANLNTAYKIADFGLIVSFGSGLVQQLFPNMPANQAPGVNGTINSFAQLGSAVGGLLLTLAGIFFTMGFTMAFFVPLIPFMSFFFGVLTWVVAMLEAVIAVPLVALAHLTPEGAGLPGDLARTAYFFIFQVFLRPTLMIFGLLCGFLIFYLSVAFLNTMYPIAVAGTGGLSHGHFTSARIIYTMIYVLLVVSSANHSFQLITRLPDTAMQWMGQSGLQGANMGDAGTLERDVSAIQAYVTQQGIPQVNQAAMGTGSMVGGLGRSVGLGRPAAPEATGGNAGGTR